MTFGHAVVAFHELSVNALYAMRHGSRRGRDGRRRRTDGAGRLQGFREGWRAEGRERGDWRGLMRQCGTNDACGENPVPVQRFAGELRYHFHEESLLSV